MSVAFETLGPGDEKRLDDFLSQHAASSMFLRSNARAAGLHDGGALHQGTYVAAVCSDRIEGVVAHYWNGILVLQSPTSHLGAAARHAVERSGRHVAGIAGPWDQVLAARDALVMNDCETSRSSPESLYSLDLETLELPASIQAGRATAVVPSGRWLDAAVQMRVAFCVEALGHPETDSLRQNARNEISRLAASQSTFLLVEDDCPVSVASFNARLPDCVQLGGVFTPPDRRGRGYARSLVAAALLSARREGVERAVLFTGEENVAARRAYEALRFQIVGTYGLCLFR